MPSIVIKQMKIQMIYEVKAMFRPEKAYEFWQILGDGTVARQKPDGSEIVASMKRAVVTSDGHVQWSELCYCDTPLKHERETVLDRCFAGIRTNPISSQNAYEGKPFLDYLNRLANP